MNKVEKLISKRLIARGKKLFKSKRQFIRFTKNQDADNLLNDLERYPHAFVLACIMDRQMKAEKAWLIPYIIFKKLNSFTINELSKLSYEEICQIMNQPNPLHRFVDKMANYFYLAIQRIKNNYDGNAANIWLNSPSSAEIVYRFLEFEGVGPKIASMAANILAREFKITFSDYYSIDVSADVHVRRVFSRLGLCSAGATPEQVIYKARALNPKFPGLMDMPAWEIGRNWCKAKNIFCEKCYMSDICPTAKNF
ncbi:iron-sulfur cluster loop [Calditrichota bacterium LG25]